MNDPNALVEHSGNNLEHKEAAAWMRRDLGEMELRAIQMRYQGKTSSEIATATGFRSSYVRKLFMKTGRLRQSCEDYALYHKGGAKEAADIVIERAKEEAPKAMERMVELSKDFEQGPVAFKSNEYLLNQAGLAAEASFRAYLQKTPYEHARDKINQLFLDVYDKPHESTPNSINLSPEIIEKLIRLKEQNSRRWKAMEEKCRE